MLQAHIAALDGPFVRFVRASSAREAQGGASLGRFATTSARPDLAVRRSSGLVNDLPSSCRYMSLEHLAKFGDKDAVSLPAAAS
jgi:hypothetical protein